MSGTAAEEEEKEEARVRAQFEEARVQRLPDDLSSGEAATEGIGGGASAVPRPCAEVGAAAFKASDADLLCGRWASEKGHISISRDPLCNRLAYEEPCDDWGRIHGWIVPSGTSGSLKASTSDADVGANSLIWHSSLVLLGPGEENWYGPGSGREQPEEVGTLQLQYINVPPASLVTRLAQSWPPGDDAWQAPMIFSRVRR
eukprot:NODE_18688_length_881_cov_4.627321.p1 GENE.NODE_18688_length_881_cov_4.627321~~NODE_18688_length_881_cov_4.627321.p1  ORF type:complete len:201 (+),score=35.56 NODE_18688_length_881_cov_4.627321:110-712(+)